MAGFYPDVPGPRIPYDVDGTYVFLLDASAGSYVRDATPTEIGNISDDNPTTGFTYAGYIVFLFEHLKDLDGWYLSYTLGSAGSGLGAGWSWSGNTTNGIDGTWTSMADPSVVTSDPAPARTDITPLSLSGVKAVRFRVLTSTGLGRSMYGTHFYGTPSSGENLDRLALWHPTLDEALDASAYFDWSDTAQQDVKTKTFRVKNLSTTLQANSVDITTEDTRTGASPSVSSQIEYDVNGGGYNSTASLGNLAADTISDLITARYTVNGAATLGLWWARMRCEADSWS